MYSSAIMSQFKVFSLSWALHTGVAGQRVGAPGCPNSAPFEVQCHGSTVQCVSNLIDQVDCNDISPDCAASYGSPDAYDACLIHNDCATDPSGSTSDGRLCYQLLCEYMAVSSFTDPDKRCCSDFDVACPARDACQANIQIDANCCTLYENIDVCVQNACYADTSGSTPDGSMPCYQWLCERMAISSFQDPEDRCCSDYGIDCPTERECWDNFQVSGNCCTLYPDIFSCIEAACNSYKPFGTGDTPDGDMSCYQWLCQNGYDFADPEDRCCSDFDPGFKMCHGAGIWCDKDDVVNCDDIIPICARYYGSPDAYDSCVENYCDDDIVNTSIGGTPCCSLYPDLDLNDLCCSSTGLNCPDGAVVTCPDSVPFVVDCHGTSIDCMPGDEIDCNDACAAYYLSSDAYDACVLAAMYCDQDRYHDSGECLITMACRDTADNQSNVEIKGILAQRSITSATAIRVADLRSSSAKGSNFKSNPHSFKFESIDSSVTLARDVDDINDALRRHSKTKGTIKTFCSIQRENWQFDYFGGNADKTLDVKVNKAIITQDGITGTNGLVIPPLNLKNECSSSSSCNIVMTCQDTWNTTSAVTIKGTINTSRNASNAGYLASGQIRGPRRNGKYTMKVKTNGFKTESISGSSNIDLLANKKKPGGEDNSNWINSKTTTCTILQIDGENYQHASRHKVTINGAVINTRQSNNNKNTIGIIKK